MNQRAPWGLLMRNLQSPNWTIITDTSWLISCRLSGGLDTPMPERVGVRVSLMNPNRMSAESYPSNARSDSYTQWVPIPSQLDTLGLGFEACPK